MRNNKENKIRDVATYYVENNSTVRKTAIFFGISKSSVYQYVSNKINYIDSHLAEQCKRLLETNKELRAIHGGEANRRKYCKLRELKLNK